MSTDRHAAEPASPGPQGEAPKATGPAAAAAGAPGPAPGEPPTAATAPPSPEAPAVAAADAGAEAGDDAPVPEAATAEAAEPAAAPADTDTGAGTADPEDGPAAPAGAGDDTAEPDSSSGPAEAAAPAGTGDGSAEAGDEPAEAESRSDGTEADAARGGGDDAEAADGSADTGEVGTEADAAGGAGGPAAKPMLSERGGEGEGPAGPEPTPTAEGDAAAPQLSEAQAELAAQRVERDRIARRKAQRQAPVEAGAKLSGTAADLLAAVRAVESGEKPSPRYFDEAPTAPRRPAPAPAPSPATPPRPRPAAAAAPAAPPAASVEAVRAVLARGGAPEQLAAPAASALGETAAEELVENPWRLLALAGIRPTQADSFARALLGPAAGPGDERRAAALVGWLLEQAAVKGHTALDAPTLESALAQYGVPQPAEALEQAVAEGLVLVFHEPLGAPVADGEEGEEGEEQPVRVLMGLEAYALAEESLADGLARLAGTFTGVGDAAAWQEAATGTGADLIRAVAAHGLVVHTGGEAARAEPLALLEAAGKLGLRTCLAAHAPAPATARGAVTVAGLLAGTEGPERNADGQFALDLLVVLDAPQLDVESAAELVESVPDGARLVLSGDPAVLGSAGPGRVFADVLAARACPQVVSRIPDPGPLGELVSGIGIGELNQVEAPGKEVVIVPVRDAGEAVHRTVQLVAESVPRAFGIAADGIQVITPGHGGPAGTRALNAALKERLNPGPARFDGFDPGDRIVHVPSPGRAVPGRVVSADAQGLHLETAGGRIVVPKEQVAAQVRHGWAVTAHQAVGMRWPAVVAVLPGDAAPALSRDWVYTAFGRAERHLSVVHGVDQALPRAVAEVLPKPRTTRLAGLLRTLAAAAGEQPE
ncbi:helix-hairpin-helix domain-containing protein [Streptomyces sp. NPDC047718]|uniref:helix-hairpin-helix domain-containing protein n=1 Tax=Streptomyces sp. NPDC047718 TaxID=3155479 RepID=UPI0034078307